MVIFSKTLSFYSLPANPESVCSACFVGAEDDLVDRLLIHDIPLDGLGALEI